MSTLFQTKFRQSTDTFTPNLWYVYRDHGNNNHELITGADSPEEAQELVNSAYKDEVEATINSIDNQQIVSVEFLEQALSDGLSKLAAVESFFNDNSFDISQLKPLKGSVSDFHTEVRKLNRPYVAISNSDQEKLMAGKADYFLTTGGKVVSFGGATTQGGNGEFALLPLNDEESQKILKNNK
jgi:hypothetical protein